MSRLKRNGQLAAGFTLIELLVVVVILGVLAAAVMPRFANLRSAAIAAQLEGVYNATQSAATLVFLACQLDAVCNPLLPASNANATRVCPQASCTQDELVSTHYGYPNATEAGIVRMLVLEGVGFTGSGTQINLRSGDMVNNVNGCRVRYLRAMGLGERPQIERFTTAC